MSLMCEYLNPEKNTHLVSILSTDFPSQIAQAAREQILLVSHEKLINYS